MCRELNLQDFTVIEIFNQRKVYLLQKLLGYNAVSNSLTQFSRILKKVPPPLLVLKLKKHVLKKEHGALL